MQALLTLNCFPAGMELFPAADDDQWTLIKREIDNSDYYLVVLAGRYGLIDPPSGLSYTEKEYDYALATAKPIIAFLHKDPDSLPKKQRETDPDLYQKLKRFHEKVKKKLVMFWTSPQDLENAVLRSCLQLFNSRPAEGWVRARSARRQEDLEKMTELQDKLQLAEEQIATLRRTNPEYNGLMSVSTGSGRDDAFQAIRARAKHQIIVVGIGMSQITMYAKRTVSEQARSVPIDFMMIDPDFLDSNPAFADRLQEFLDIRDFRTTAKASYTVLKTLAEEWNSDQNNPHGMRLKVYRTIPTMSMVMIDPDTPNGEFIIEFFLYQSGEYRPRFHVRKTDETESLFSRIHSEYLRLWNSARRVV